MLLENDVTGKLLEAGLVRGNLGSHASSCHRGLLEGTAQQHAPHHHKDLLPSLCADPSCLAAMGAFSCRGVSDADLHLKVELQL